MAMLPILAMTFLFATVGGSMLYMTNQRQKAIYAQATAAQGKLAGGAAINIAASVLDAQVVRGFTVVNPPNATYWTIYPASAVVNQNAFTFNPGIVAAPHDNSVVSTAQMSVGDLCNPATLSALNFGNVMSTGLLPTACGSPGANPSTCCYHVPSTLSLKSALPAQYLEVLSQVGDVAPTAALSNQVPQMQPTGKGSSNRVRFRIPALAPLPPPLCGITLQYQYIYWHQYDLSATFWAKPPPDFPPNTEGTTTDIRFPPSAGPPPNANFPPGTVNGINTASTNPVPVNAAAANGAGAALTIRPPDIGNVNALFTLPGEVTGPGGLGTCPQSFNQLVLPAPSTCSIATAAGSIYWMDSTTATYTQPIPPPPASTAPLPPAYLASGTITAANGTIQGGPSTTFPLSTASNVMGGLLVTANGSGNVDTVITLTGRSLGQGGNGAICTKTVNVAHVGPPTCTISANPARNGSTAGISIAVTTSPPVGGGLNSGLYMPTSVVVSESGYGRSWATTMPGSGGSTWLRPPSEGTPTYTAAVTGPSGTGYCSVQIGVGHAGCSLTANPNPDKMSNPPDVNSNGDWRSTLALTTNAWTDAAWGDNYPNPTMPYYGDSWMVYPGSCWTAAASNPVHYNGYASGIGGSFTCGVDLYLQCPDYMVADYIPGCSALDFFYGGCSAAKSIRPFTDYCIRGITNDEFLLGAVPSPTPPHYGVVNYYGIILAPTAWFGTPYETAGIWNLCADAEYAVNAPPNCHWEHCLAGSGCSNRGCEGGCFDLNAKILMADHSLRTAIDVHAGDEVWNPVRREAMKVKRTILGPEPYRLYEIGYDAQKVRVSKEHPMVTRRGLKRADQIKSTDEILGADFLYHPITVLRRPPIPEGQKVINYEFENRPEAADDHMLVSDGIITGDWTLQKRLEKEAAEALP